MLCLNAVTDEDGHLPENEDESGRKLCEHWSKILEVRVEGERHHCQETIFRYVQTAPDIQCQIDRHDFDEIMATKKESAPSPDGTPYSLYRCAGGLGSMFFFKVSKHILAGWPCSCTVFCEQDRFHSQVLRRR